ncbi:MULTISPECIES: YARHG domain-containing protein [unclassified Sphingobacterium]|uniref:YARHG domain-containing protein n=1 Tax=unclassified Sphingobacterium TaxID=2609468 RepID=UPI0025EF6586|nr:MULTISPECIES: YARHG domain-containing protein [unclassified Sphingobacterium]
MKNFLLILSLLLCFTAYSHANDGAFFARGNQLVPINETDISVRKEILTIRKAGDRQVHITVYYEFENPVQDKRITVGFEAMSPSGDVDGTPKNGFHPYMRDFTVKLNNQDLPYKVAYVYDSLYVNNGKILSEPLDKIKKEIDNVNEVGFNYVYYFDAPFRKGKNSIQHTYTYDLSGSIDYQYYLEYVLTAAKRWANKQIDDFTLIVDMGDVTEFNIHKTFFDQKEDWQIKGWGKTKDVKVLPSSVHESDQIRFTIRQGTLVFHKTNFAPAGELYLSAENYFPPEESFDSKTDILPFAAYAQNRILKAKDETSKKILRNLPFARRGYVFKSKDLKDYYSNIDWYTADPKYIPEPKNLTPEEQKWLKELK